MNKIAQIFLAMIGLLLGWYLVTKGLEVVNAPDWSWTVASISFGLVWLIWANVIIFRKTRK